MFCTVQARAFLNVWRPTCRGFGVNIPLDANELLYAEYAIELIGKRSFERVVADYFRSHGKPEFMPFLRSVGLKTPIGDAARMAGDLYMRLAGDLYVVDYPAPSMDYVTVVLPGLAASVLPVVDAAVQQCIQYNARNWHYFRRVAEQMAATVSARDHAEEESIEGQRLPPGYFEELQAVRVSDVAAVVAEARLAIESAIDDRLMGEYAKKIG